MSEPILIKGYPLLVEKSAYDALQAKLVNLLAAINAVCPSCSIYGPPDYTPCKCDVLRKLESDAIEEAYASLVTGLTVPEDAQDMVNWLVNYDDTFKGKPVATVLAYLVSEGAKAVYNKGLENITPV